MFAFLPPGLPVFVATTPGMGGKLKQRLSASRESHPSEVLSELPPLFETVAGQEYHCVLTRSLRNSLSAVLWPDGYRSPPCLAVFDGVSPTGGSWRTLQSRCTLVRRFARERISVAGYDRRTRPAVFFKVQWEPLPAAAGKGKLIKDTVQHDQIVTHHSGFHALEQFFLLGG